MRGGLSRLPRFSRLCGRYRRLRRGTISRCIERTASVASVGTDLRVCLACLLPICRQTRAHARNIGDILCACPRDIEARPRTDTA